MSTFKKRIDELGRIVIPKQIRNNFKINNFDELELNIEKDYIVIKKSIGIEMYKDKLDRLLSLLSSLFDFKIIITDKNNVISSNYDGINYRNELLVSVNDEKYVETPIIKGYVESLPIIVDSNNIGNIYYICNSKLEEKSEIIKKIREVIIDVIN